MARIFCILVCLIFCFCFYPLELQCIGYAACQELKEPIKSVKYTFAPQLMAMARMVAVKIKR